MNIEIKLAVLVILIIASLLIYYFIVKRPVDNVPSTINIPDVTKLKINPNSPAVYISSPNTGKLYMRDIKGNYWDCGFVSDCPALSGDYNTLVIQNVYQMYNYGNVPEKYKNNKDCASLQLGQVCVVQVQTAEEYEKKIVAKIIGKYTPDKVTCNGNGITQGNIDTGKLIENNMKEYNKSFADHVKENASELIQLASTIGVIGGLSWVLSKFAATEMLAPLIGPFVLAYGSLTELVNGNVNAAEQGAIQMALIEIKSGLVSLTERLRNGIEIFEKGGADSLVDSTVEVSTKVAIDVSTEMGASLAGALAACLDLLDPALWLLEGVMLLGMILDAIDPCNLSKGFMTQDSLDKFRQAYEIQMYITTKASYPVVWNASLSCEYNLNATSHWNQCMTDEEKKASGMTKDQYCADDQKKIQEYSNEYLGALKVNSQGQCLKGITNQELVQILNLNAPGPDWSSIGQITRQNTPSFKLPSDQFLKQLDLLFVDNNVVVAGYVAHYWYVVTIFLLIIIIMIVFL